MYQSREIGQFFDRNYDFFAAHQFILFPTENIDFDFQVFDEKDLEYYITVLFFTRLFRRGESQAYKIKAVLFLFVLCFLAATKNVFKRKVKVLYISL